ncbi:MAG: hypothetical protein IPL59_08420 [Candidatus Competibacteraceae bacterium]|nr:hypothetical protein [Candidatus Competibacteraceae bacterium]
MERFFLRSFGVDLIAVLLADREFVGEAWFRWLQGNGSSSSTHRSQM